MVFTFIQLRFTKRLEGESSSFLGARTTTPKDFGYS